jgi:hypothetical protein
MRTRTVARLKDDADGWLGLLCAIVADTPRLRNAASRGRWDVFDGDGEEHIHRAVALCQTCPERSACQDWASGRRDVSGVLGGQYWGYYRKRDKPPSEAI